MTSDRDFVWAWALAPLVPRDVPRAVAFQQIRLVAPRTVLEQTAAVCAREGLWASKITRASPPLQDNDQVVLAATIEQFERVADSGHPQLTTELRRVLAAVTDDPPTVTLGRHRFDFASRVYVIGILNNTPDSFYDRGRFFGRDAALARAEEIVSQGADLIEVGGETAQEGDRLSAREEINRVAPLIEELVRRYRQPVAVDTYKADVARAAIEAGAVLVNDISGMADPSMPAVIAERRAGIVMMHLHGRPKQHYTDIDVPSMMDWVAAYLRRRIDAAVAAGIPRERLFVDPGLNFGKKPHRDIELLQRLSELRNFGLPIFVAASRKDFIRDLLHLHPDDLLEGTAAAVAFAITQGANLIRVHDVEPMVRVTRMMEFFCGHRRSKVAGRT
ncbi:MAG TPA: dihydropteroate synthase [bacterium]|nr:dihydropteroate synthase [bacterium]